MASRRGPRTVVGVDLDRLEGLLQQLRETDAHARPKATTTKLIAEHCGFPEQTVREWVRKIRPLSKRSTTEKHFFDLYDQIAGLLSERCVANIYDLAVPGPSARDAFKANKWLLERLHPDVYDPAVADESAMTEPDDGVLDLSSVPQEIFDAMTPAELERVERLEQQVEDAIRQAVRAWSTLVEEVEARVARDKRRAIAH